MNGQRRSTADAGPGAEIPMFFGIHGALLTSIDVEMRGGLLQTGQLAAVTRIDRCETAAFRRLFAPSPIFIVSREGRRGGRERARNSGFGVCFVGYKKIRKSCHREVASHRECYCYLPWICPMSRLFSLHRYSWISSFGERIDSFLIVHLPIRTSGSSTVISTSRCPRSGRR